MNVELEARSGASAEMLEAHGLALAIDSLDGRAEGPQATPLGPAIAFYFPNQCGPGSATKLISGWMSAPNTYTGGHYVSGQDTPLQGYVLWLGIEMGMMSMSCG